MTFLDGLQVLLFAVGLVVLAPPLGRYMAAVFTGRRTFMHRIFGGMERLLYRVCGINERQEMTSWQYIGAVALFGGVGLVALTAMQMFQSVLPFNPQGFGGVSWHLALNTAISFITNTNWQAYSGEATFGYGLQALGLGVQNFVSAATGIAVMVALARGFSRKESGTIGNFWVDMVRSTLYVLLPLSILLAVVLSAEGVVQTLSGYTTVHTLEGAEQVIPLGPAASQIAIKQLGTNGGGFFGVNSAHPFENPTPLTNYLEILALLLIPAALTLTYGYMVGSARQGWALFAAMSLIFCAGLGVSLWAEHAGNPLMGGAAMLEGKEMRFGITNSVIWSNATTVASNGSVSAMHDSLSPLTGLITMVNMMLGEIIFGGVGSGMYGMAMFVIVTVFIAGLMVGRTPEYLGKKIERYEIRMAMLAILAPCVVILISSAIAVCIPAGTGTIANGGPHGLSEILYAMTSAAGNNGSAFAGLGVNTVFYNMMTGAVMLIGRYGVIIPVLLATGSIAAKRTVPPSAGTFPTDTPLFVVLLIGVILIVGALTFFPVLSLAPIAEHLLMHGGSLF